MRNQFKITVMMLITSISLSAQKQDIYKKSFDAENLTILVLDLENSYVQIEPSKDNKVHFDYSIEFENYSKKEIEKALEKVEVTTQIVNDKLEFKARSNNALSDVSFSIETLFGITFEGDYISFKEPTTRQFRQSKQYFYSINSSSRGKSTKEYLRNLRRLDSKGGKKKINRKNVKILKTKFVIKIPSHLNLRINAINSNMSFKLDISSQITINTRNTSLKFRSITNLLNSFDIVNGDFRSNVLKGGTYRFNHVKNVQIAEVSNLTIDSEFTTTKIGEIGKNVEIVDFNSKFWLHNFSNNFGDFKMTTEYSEINLFYPENIKFKLTTFGHDTVHYTDNTITEIPPSRKNISSKMMLIGEGTNPNKIQIKTVHGIIRFGKDFIDF